MVNIENVFTGWGRVMGLLDTPKEVQDLSVLRLSECVQCEHAKHSKFLEFLNNGAEDIDGLYCGLCKCPCHQKSVTNEKCPLGKWDNIKLVTN